MIVYLSYDWKIKDGNERLSNLEQKYGRFKEQNETVHFSTVMEFEPGQLVEIWRDMIISPDLVLLLMMWGIWPVCSIYCARLRAPILKNYRRIIEIVENGLTTRYFYLHFLFEVAYGTLSEFLSAKNSVALYRDQICDLRVQGKCGTCSLLEDDLCFL